MRRAPRDFAHLYGDAVLDSCLGRVERDLVVGLVAVLEAEVIVLELNVEEREDELLANLLPTKQSSMKELRVAAPGGIGWVQFGSAPIS